MTSSDAVLWDEAERVYVPLGSELIQALYAEKSVLVDNTRIVHIFEGGGHLQKGETCLPTPSVRTLAHMAWIVTHLLPTFFFFLAGGGFKIADATLCMHPAQHGVLL